MQSDLRTLRKAVAELESSVSTAKGEVAGYARQVRGQMQSGCGISTACGTRDGQGRPLAVMAAARQGAASQAAVSQLSELCMWVGGRTFHCKLAAVQQVVAWVDGERLVHKLQQSKRWQG